MVQNIEVTYCPDEGLHLRDPHALNRQGNNLHIITFKPNLPSASFFFTTSHLHWRLTSTCLQPGVSVLLLLHPRLCEKNNN